jgi:hypothetical protein
MAEKFYGEEIITTKVREFFDLRLIRIAIYDEYKIPAITSIQQVNNGTL